MRVLIVTQYYWPEQFRITDLAEGMASRGHEVTVLTGSPNYPGGRIFSGYGYFNDEEAHNRVRILRIPLIPRGSGSPVHLALNYLSFLVSGLLLGPLKCRGAFDVLFVCQLSPVTVALPAILLRYFKSIPIIMWVLDLWPESISAAGGIGESWLYRRVDDLVRFIYRHCDRILYTSKGFASSIQSRGVTPARLGYVPNWVEPVENDSLPITIQLPVGFRVLFAGNIGEAQDFGTILEAAERLQHHPKIQWIILGEGRQLAWVKEQVLARGLSQCFHLLGRFPADTMSAFFEAADALLVTLKRDPAFALTVPGKIPSYMSCGRPILAAIDGEGAQVIQEAGAGFAVPSGDAEGLARIVLELSLMPLDSRAALGRSAKVFCEAHFDRETLFQELDRTMDTVVRTKRAI